MKIIDEIWATDDLNITDFMSTHSDFSKKEDGSWCSTDCTVTITRLPDRTFSRFALPQTRLQVVGSAAAVDSFCYHFRLRFLTAGG